MAPSGEIAATKPTTNAQAAAKHADSPNEPKFANQAQMQPGIMPNNEPIPNALARSSSDTWDLMVGLGAER
jgi:hypothetical protein